MDSKNSESAYSYACELHYGQGLNWTQVKFALIEEGFTELQAKEMIANLKEQESEEINRQEYNRILHEAAFQEEAQRIYEEEMKNPTIALKRAEKKIKYGFLWILGGILLTVITQGMVIWWGAVLYGIIRVCSGSHDKNVINNNQKN